MEIKINTKVELEDDLAEALMSYGAGPEIRPDLLDDPRFPRLEKAGLYGIGPGPRRPVITEKGTMILEALSEKAQPVIDKLGRYGIKATPDAHGGIHLDQHSVSELLRILVKTAERERPLVPREHPIVETKPLNYGHKPGAYPHSLGNCPVCQNRTDYSRGGDGPNCPGCGRS